MSLQMTDTYQDPKEAFDRAIKVGRLSADPEDKNYAGKYMYMGTTSFGLDKFKNINTRQYI